MLKITVVCRQDHTKLACNLIQPLRLDSLIFFSLSTYLVVIIVKNQTLQYISLVEKPRSTQDHKTDRKAIKIEFIKVGFV